MNIQLNLIVFTLFIFLIDIIPQINASICGDGIVDLFNEECDSSLHCTDCYCDEGYHSENGICQPQCDIAGCHSGCINPNECASCEEPNYQWDCHRCGDGYLMEGFMKCVPFDENNVYTCQDIISNSSMKTNRHITLNSTLTDDRLDIIFLKTDLSDIENLIMKL